MKSPLALILSLLAALLPTTAISMERDIERWIDKEAIPFMQQQLAEHPRFKGQTVMFVVLDDNAPATASNTLALSLRDRLLAAALDTPGVTIGWRQGRSDARNGTEGVDCTRDDVHYYIGIEIEQQLDGGYALSLRALDLEERTLVTGFGRNWLGRLNMTQRRALQEEKPDPSFLGARDVPFTAEQNDLLAKHLAHELSCALHRQTNGDYVVATDIQAATVLGLDGTIALVSNNIAANDAIELTSDPALANAELSGKAHRIDGSLYQYWLSVTPRGEDSELSSLTVSAYLLRPDNDYVRNEYSTPARTLVAMPQSQRGTLIGSRSFADDAVVFFVQHQPHFGLVRLDNGVCRARTVAQVVRAGEPFQFPVAYAHSRNSETIETDTWYAAPIRDTYYAIAISDAKTARRLANHLDNLPIRCGASTRQGLTGAALRDWLTAFAGIAAEAEQFIDWRAIEIKDVL